MEQAQTRLSLVGPTGSGKTTSAWLMQRMIPGAVVLSLAQPLRDIEECFHRVLGLAPPSATGVQDGALLQQIRAILFQREPNVLLSTFTRAMASCSASPLVINDDCRAASKPLLDGLGFRYVWVDGSHRERRLDSSPASPTPSGNDTVIPDDLCELTLRNTGSFADLVRQIDLLCDALGVSR